jgi:hypothetical protein
MPFYKIDIRLRCAQPPGPERVISVVRQYKEPDIEKVWHILEVKSRKKWESAMKAFSCVQISKRSEEYQEYLKRQGKGPAQEDDELYNLSAIPGGKRNN